MQRWTGRTLAIVAVCVFASTMARANVVWPALYLESRLVSLWAIPAGLLVEFGFLRWWLGFSLWRAILADIVMNSASTVLGAIMVPIAGLGWELVVGQWINRTFNVGTFNPSAWVATCALAVLINTGIEGLVLRYAFKAKLTRAQWGGLGLANVVSVGLAMASLQISPLQL